MRPRRWAFALHAKCYEPVRSPIFLGVGQNFAANEFRLCQVDEHPGSGSVRIVPGGRFRAVERITHLKPKGVARAEAAGANPEVLALVEDRVPDFCGVPCREESFHAVFPGVSSPRDRQPRSVKIEILDLIARRQFRVLAYHCVEQLDDTRPLDREAAVFRAPVLQRAAVAKMLLQPREVFTSPRRIDDEQELFRRGPVNNQVVNDPTAVVEEKRVLPRADLELVDVIREHLVQPRACSGPGRLQLPHVRDVENAHVFPDRLVLVDNAAVLHRHDPVAERDHLRAEPHMLLVEWRLFWRGFSHGGYPRWRGFCVNAGALPGIWYTST